MLDRVVSQTRGKVVCKAPVKHRCIRSKLQNAHARSCYHYMLSYNTFRRDMTTLLGQGGKHFNAGGTRACPTSDSHSVPSAADQADFPNLLHLAFFLDMRLGVRGMQKARMEL
jgi:hypothetical protein